MSAWLGASQFQDVFISVTNDSKMFVPEAKGCLQRHSPIFFCIGPGWQSQNILQIKQAPGINLWFAICSTKSKSQVLQTFGHSSPEMEKSSQSILKVLASPFQSNFCFSIYTHWGTQWLNPNPPPLLSHFEKLEHSRFKTLNPFGGLGNGCYFIVSEKIDHSPQITCLPSESQNWNPGTLTRESVFLATTY